MKPVLYPYHIEQSVSSNFSKNSMLVLQLWARTQSKEELGFIVIVACICSGH